MPDPTQTEPPTRHHADLNMGNRMYARARAKRSAIGVRQAMDYITHASHKLRELGFYVCPVHHWAADQTGEAACPHCATNASPSSPDS